MNSTSAQAAVCTIASDTVVDQAYVDAGSCSAIEIDALGSVSTTWIGTVDLQGAGTVTVKSGSIMAMGSSSEMILGATDDFVIETGATTTHTGEDKNGLKITARNITITGALSASEKGCRRAALNGADGYGVDVATGFCGLQTGGYGRGGGGSGQGGGGGSHAGRGGGGGPSREGGTIIYGNSLLPSFLGSGGGTGYYTTAFGGAGGGLIHVTSTGTLTVNGAITARGAAGGYDGVWNGGGGGAGGSILIRAGTLAGSGSISVSGGAGGAGGGGGSAGRVAVFYGSSSFSLSNITAAAGQGGAGGLGGNGVSGAAGTTYFLNRYVDDGAGTVTITNTFDFPSGGDYARDAFAISSGASLGCSTSTAALTVSSTAWLSLDNVTWACTASIPEITLASNAGLSTTNTVMTFTAATSVNLIAPAWTNVTTTFVLSKSGARSIWDISSALTLRNLAFATLDAGVVDASGGFLFLPRGIPLTLVSSTIAASVSSTSLTALSVDAQSKIDASSRGCPRSMGAVNGYGPNVTTGICGQSVGGYGAGGGGTGDSGSGAAHAGVGGNGSVGLGAGVLGSTATYGSSTEPVLFGSSGGGGYFTNTGAGGGAGGIIHLIVSGALTVDGTIRADGGQGVYSGAWAGGGGGAGGSVNLRVGSLAGSGSISANGGRGADGGTGAGGGGGGRIALRYSSLSFSGTSSTTLGAAGTGGASPGAAGTIYTLQMNTAPSVPASLGPTALVNGSTTGTANPLFTFSLSDPDVADTVRYRIQIDDTADFGSPVVDYTSALAAQGSASFQVGQAQGSGTYTVGTNGQTLSNGSYYWRVKTIDPVAAESSYTTANSGLVAFIVDATARTLGFESTILSGLESETATSVRIVLNTAHFETVSVNYAVYSPSSTAEGSGTDYTLTAGTATITAGQTSTTISLAIVNDSITETAEDLVIVLSSPVNAVLGVSGTTTYTIVDNDTAGVTVSSVTGSAVEGGGSATYTLVLTSQPTSTVSIVLDTDLSQVSLSTSTIYFTTSNWSTPQTITVSAINDSIDELTFATSVTHVIQTTGLYGFTPDLSIASASISVVDNDVAGVTVSPTSLSLSEGGASSTYTLVLTSQPTSTVRITLTASAQVTISTSSIDFTSDNWSTPQTITINAAQDTSQEGTHSGTVAHSATVPSGYAYGFSSSPSISTVTATIADDDIASVAVSVGRLSINEGQSESFTVLLGTAPTTTVEVLVAAGSGLAVSTSTVVFNASSYATPVTITVTSINDSVYTGNRSSLVSLTVSTTAGGYSTLTLPDLTIAIVEDERTGGGAVGGGPGGGSISPIAFIVPVVQNTQTPPVSLPQAAPIITVVPDLPTNSTPLPTSSGVAEVVTILNHSDVLSLVRATQSSRDFEREGRVLTNVTRDLKEMEVSATEADKLSLSNFITYGISERTFALGEGERRALVRDSLETMKTAKISPMDLERLARGMIPQFRNLAAERSQVKRAQMTFKTIYGHDPDFKNLAENLAWNTLMYRIRFPRDLNAEREGIQEFQALFRRAPRDPFQWAVVRVLGYVR